MKLLDSLWKRFPVKYLGKCTWYDGFGIETDPEYGTTKLTQKAYIESVLKRFDVT